MLPLTTFNLTPLVHLHLRLQLYLHSFAALCCRAQRGSSPLLTSHHNSQRLAITKHISPPFTITRPPQPRREGSFAVVRNAVHLPTGVDVAIKVFDKSKIVDEYVL